MLSAVQGVAFCALRVLSLSLSLSLSVSIHIHICLSFYMTICKHITIYMYVGRCPSQILFVYICIIWHITCINNYIYMYTYIGFPHQSLATCQQDMLDAVFSFCAMRVLSSLPYMNKYIILHETPCKHITVHVHTCVPYQSSLFMYNISHMCI